MGRRLERWQLRVAYFTLIQLLVGSVYVVVRAQRTTVPAPASAVEMMRQGTQLEALTERVKGLEAVNSAARLSVLEDMKSRIEKIEMLVWGQLITLGGTIVLFVLNLKGSQHRRRQSDPDPA